MSQSYMNFVTAHNFVANKYSPSFKDVTNHTSFLLFCISSMSIRDLSTYRMNAKKFKMSLNDMTVLRTELEA